MELEWILGSFGVVSAMVDALLGWTALRLIRKIPKLESLDGRPPDRYPRLTIVMPACNEAETILPAARTLLEGSYPDLELIFVDDRSSDTTGQIIDHLAATDPRVRAIHIEELPKGWLGKVHALHVGAREATGEWILFTDADIHFEAKALERVLRIALEEKLDFVAIGPHFKAEHLLLRTMMVSFTVAYVLGVRPDRLARGSKDHSAGVGAFNLVRRELFERSEGFPFIRLEVADDVGLGLMMQRAGARSGFFFAERCVSVAWYESVRAMWRGLEKNLFGVSSRWRLHRAVVIMLALASAIFGPWIGLLVGPTPLIRVAAGAGIIITMITQAGISRRMQFGCLAGIASPLGSVLLLVALFRSTFVTLRARGIRWRGTFYPLDLLRAGQRLKI